jgi:hypothetical protein
MDKLLPTLPNPYTLMELPHLLKARKDIELPMCTKSNTDKLDPSLVNP